MPKLETSLLSIHQMLLLNMPVSCGNLTKSGDFDGEDTPMSKAGNRYLRYYLGEAANSMKKHNVEYGAYYRKKYNEVPKHQHKRALALTSRKFVRLVYGLLAKNQLYSGVSLDKSTE